MHESPAGRNPGSAVERMIVREADITDLDVDAIVNAANERLAPGGGVCGAIHRAAGPGLAAECAAIGGCPTGEARLSRGYDLRAAYVIHTVGPVWHGGDRGEEELLASCYRSSLHLAAEHGLESIALPAISTGIFGFPLDRATDIALAVVHGWLTENALPSEVVFCVFGSEAAAAYARAYRELPGSGSERT